MSSALTYSGALLRLRAEVRSGRERGDAQRDTTLEAARRCRFLIDVKYTVKLF